MTLFTLKAIQLAVNISAMRTLITKRIRFFEDVEFPKWNLHFNRTERTDCCLAAVIHGNIIIDWIDFLLNELVSRSKIENSIIHLVLGKMTMNPSNIIIVPFNYIFMSYSMKVRTATTTVRNDEKLCHTRKYVGIFVVRISWLVLLVHLQLRCIALHWRCSMYLCTPKV